MKPCFYCALLAITLAWVTPASQAEVVRYRFVLVNAQGNTTATPIGPGGAVGVRTSYRGTGPQPEANLKRPTHLVTVVHPATGKAMTVPLTLPDDTPRMEHRTNRIIYNYGTYTVEIHFLADGSVETVYNSGLLRPLR